VAASQLINGDSVIIGLPLDEVNATVTQLTLVIALVTLAGLIFAFLIASFVVRLAMRPLARVASTAQEVAELPLDHGEVALSVRVPEEDTDPNTEVGTVGAALNRMLGHIGSALTARQASEKKVRQFVADASHELRTPLALLRAEVELALETPRPERELRAALHSVGEEADRLSQLAEDLLLLARLDEGVLRLRTERIDVGALLDGIARRFGRRAAAATRRIDTDGRGLEIEGDRLRLEQAVGNLVENALRHGSGTIRIFGVEHDGTVEIHVLDEGEGVPPEFAARAFERFTRADEARSGPGAGLGLAIVQAVAEAHGGHAGIDGADVWVSAGVSLRTERSARPARPR
jgi:two-component system OmpR family sensor kinase